MHVIKGRNVNDLWDTGFKWLQNNGKEQSTRAGLAIVSPVPVTSVYAEPTERVLLDAARDANPFFHLFESLWMIAGRNDAAYLNKFVSDFGDRYAEDGRSIHGAYGYRWRRAFGFDQLEAVIEKLKANPNDRQCVIQMWDCNPQHWLDRYNDTSISIGQDDLNGDWKDRPCNTHCYLRVQNRHLEMTILCRSNDIVWGAYGANAVHFSMLQEYLAGRMGYRPGIMYQVSNNYHAYQSAIDNYNRKREKTPDADQLYYRRFYMSQAPMPIGQNWDMWDEDLHAFLNDPTDTRGYHNLWFECVAQPMMHTHQLYKTGNLQTAIAVAENIEADDWKFAAQRWLKRRLKTTP